MPSGVSPFDFWKFLIVIQQIIYIPNTVQSTVAPWCVDVGGGLQYKLPMPIEQLLKEGYIIKK
ncbi:MAG: glycohydrolase toxin TNT-related protein [Thermoanaerobacteraceae bacterium]